ncbi:antirestriction protein ArdA [Escherichia coli]|nr:antirestriction protein ArdA [Escherichia coli]
MSVVAPAVYVGTWHKYNCGSIAGRWFDLTTFDVRIPLYSITDWHRSPISDSHPFDQPGT